MANFDQDEYRKERRIDWDIVSAFGENGLGENLSAIAYVLATVFGANDESSWHWLLALKDGTYAYANGACDYTGWDCQSGASIDFFLTLEEAIAAVPLKDDYTQRQPRAIIKKQLLGTLPYGCES